MKKVLFLLVLLASALTIHAREPYGDYIARYIVTGTGANDYHAIYNPLKITHQGIQVKNTNAGVKTWVAHYEGPIRYINSKGAKSERFHSFYLTNQHVYFSISDSPCERYNGKMYYIIIIDGQIQLAEAVN